MTPARRKKGPSKPSFRISEAHVGLILGGRCVAGASIGLCEL